MSVGLLTTEAFYQFLNDNKTVVVDFYSPYCGACKKFAPVFERLATGGAYKTIKFATVDIISQRESSDLANHYKVHATPTFIVFVKGEKVAEFVGALEEKLVEMLNKYK